MVLPSAYEYFSVIKLHYAMNLNEKENGIKTQTESAYYYGFEC